VTDSGLPRRSAPRTGAAVPVLGLGGHEFLSDGRSRGFNEDFRTATTAGYIWPGFGGPGRLAVVRRAHAEGVAFFDVTIDAEKEALGRNFIEAPPPGETWIQTRPEGMVYRNNPDDSFNAGLADFDRLRSEVRRSLGLLRRDRVDVLNFGFTAAALRRDPDFLIKVVENAAKLKREGLIRWASADTFAGGPLLLEAIATGGFDALFLNFNVGDDAAQEEVLPAAREAGMAVHVREVYLKGALLACARDAGIADLDAAARAAVRWVLAHEAVTVAVVGAGTPEQLSNAASAARHPALTDEDRRILDAIRATERFRAFRAEKRRAFLEGAGG
jgi:aryl-alcohol dehydrogenase-like predicted oxidoreductase